MIELAVIFVLWAVVLLAIYVTGEAGIYGWAVVAMVLGFSTGFAFSRIRRLVKKNRRLAALLGILHGRPQSNGRWHVKPDDQDVVWVVTPRHRAFEEWLVSSYATGFRANWIDDAVKLGDGGYLVLLDGWEKVPGAARIRKAARSDRFVLLEGTLG